MKIAVASHIVIDTIHDTKGKTINSLGGPACYCGLTARQFGFEVILATKVGKDFYRCYMDFLRDRGITIKDYNITECPTTKFELTTNKHFQDLFLLSKCLPLTEEDIQNIKADCWLVSPVVDEVPANVLKAIVKRSGKEDFVMLDPQGYSRSIKSSSGRVSLLNEVALDLSGITALKADSQELAALTGGLEGFAAMKFLQSSRGIKFVIFTDYTFTHLLYNGTHYWMKLDIHALDYTGAGNILSAAFCCSYIKERDPLWAICFATGAVRAALESKLTGLDKIPPKSKIEQNAYYYYGTVSFQRS